MPNYTFTNEHLDLSITISCSFKDVPGELVLYRDLDGVYRGPFGVEWCPDAPIEADMVVAQRDFSATHIGGHLSSAWPMVSRAMGVMPDQIADAVKRDQALGVTANYTPEGHVVFESRAHRAAYMKARGYVDLDAGYSDSSTSKEHHYGR